jgi:hypothetical protein
MRRCPPIGTIGTVGSPEMRRRIGFQSVVKKHDRQDAYPTEKRAETQAIQGNQATQAELSCRSGSA